MFGINVEKMQKKLRKKLRRIFKAKISLEVRPGFD